MPWGEEKSITSLPSIMYQIHFKVGLENIPQFFNRKGFAEIIVNIFNQNSTKGFS